MDFRQVSEAGWQKNNGVALQNPFTFRDTVRENILLSNEEGDRNIDQVIENLGLASMQEKEVENLGENLSGGELQKISIARALAKNPKILILDEPNNNLDIEAKNWLKEFVRNYKGTLIYISHEEDMIKMADNVVEL